MTLLGKGSDEKTAEPVVTIEIFGQPYTFRADADALMAKEVAQFLEKEVNRVEVEMAGTSASITKKAILILAALNIANENFELKRNRLHFLQDIAQRSRNLIRTLDSACRQW
jgi:cell division protein ZapA (FtsZ GTPase activity inhibitor)